MKKERDCDYKKNIYSWLFMTDIL